MLKIQEWLRNNNGNLALLNEQLGIDATFHPTDNRVILNHNQITSPKLNPIVRECRGLVLDKRDWSIVACAFPRFFNLSEVPAEDAKFVWEGSIATDKEDGSLILLYFYEGQWHVNTRGSFASMAVNGLEFTWRDLFFSAFGDITRLELLSKDNTYVFELCTPYTQVVRIYKEPVIYLLSIFENRTACEVTHDYTKFFGYELNINTPISGEFGSGDSAAAHILERCKTDKTFEGVVVRDIHNNRLKIKSKTYIELHRLSNNGNVAIPRNIARIVLDNEMDEVLTYYPALKPDFDAVKSRIDKMVTEMDNLWFCHWDETSPRKFAEYVGKAKLSGLLFAAKKIGKTPKELLSEEEFKEKIISIIDREYKVKLKEKDNRNI